MMNSEELMNRAWQYDIVGMLMFVLSNTSSNDFGRVFFAIFGVAMIITSLFVMLEAFKRNLREQKKKEEIAKAIIEVLKNDPMLKKNAKNVQKRSRSVKNEKTVKHTSKKSNKA